MWTKTINQTYIAVLMLTVTVTTWGQETWSVGQAEVDDKPIVYKFISELPEEKTRKQMPWLTVVAWKYDGVGNNGMPPKEVNESINRLEDGLENIADRGSLYHMVYAATGNNLKEFVFYIADREKFMANFNQALKGHSAYPIEVSFYSDETWSDLLELHQVFEDNSEH